jgi:hypothetical protein
MGDQAFNTIAQHYAAIFGSLDFDAFEATISPTANIWFTYDNGMNEKTTVKEFLTRMRICHFENTTKTQVFNLDIKRVSPNVFKVFEETDFDCSGNGLDKEDHGVYEYMGNGQLIVGDDNLISDIRYTYAKSLKK